MGDVRNSCRLCLSDGETPIFERVHREGIPLSVKITVCLSLPIMHSDILPNLICAHCIKMIEDFYSFREVCLLTYVKLLQFDGGEDVEATTNKVHDGSSDVSSTEMSETDKRRTQEDKCKKSDGADESEEMCRSIQQVDDDSNYDDDYGDEENPLSVEDLVQECMIIKVESPMDDFDSNLILVDAKEEREHDQDDNRLPSHRNGEDTANTNSNSELTKHYNANTNSNSELTKHYKCHGCLQLVIGLKTYKQHLIRCPSIISINDDQSSDKEMEMKSSIKTEMKQKGNDVVTPVKRGRKKGEKKLYPCTICNKVFEVAARLRNHLAVHKGEYYYVCSICGRSFRQKSALRNHEMKHAGKSTHPCEQCGKGFFRPSDLQKHLRSHTGERPFMCSVCSKAFHQMSGLVVHERIHTGERPYKCTMCPMTFNQLANKQRHEKAHAGGTKPYACDVCHRKFSDEQEMEMHRAAHGGGRPWVCKHCNKPFRKPSELRDHLRRFHTNERPFQCELCSKRFFAPHEVKQHLLVHTGERPFSCELCNKSFSQKGNLRRHHIRNHTDDATFTLKDEDIIYGMADEIDSS